jgi:hypothetical protein
MHRYGRSVPTDLRKPGGPGPVWERGVRVKFHYTQPDFAELILAEQVYRVSGQEGRAGHGLYVTSARPGSMSDEDLLSLLFTRPRPAAIGCGRRVFTPELSACYPNISKSS